MDTDVRRGLGLALIGAPLFVVALVLGLALPNAQNLFGLLVLIGLALVLVGCVVAGVALLRRRGR